MVMKTAEMGIQASTCQTPVYSLDLPCTCIKIFSLSRGATAVRDLHAHLRDHHAQVCRHGIGCCHAGIALKLSTYSPPATPPAIRDFPIDVHVRDFAFDI